MGVRELLPKAMRRDECEHALIVWVPLNEVEGKPWATKFRPVEARCTMAHATFRGVRTHSNGKRRWRA